MTTLRKLALIYLGAVGLAAAWVLYVEITLLHSPQEHLLPAVVLAALTFPASLSGGLLFEKWPELFDNPFFGLLWLVICGVAQASVPFVVAGSLRRATRSKA